MRIYVACLASYNSGRLHGQWIDASSDVDEMWEQVNAMLKASPYPNIIKRDYSCACGHVWSSQVDTLDPEKPDCPKCGASAGVERSARYPSAEEFAVHDYDCMPASFGEYTSLQTIADYVGFVEDCDFDADIVRALVEACNGDLQSAAAMCERYIGTYDNLLDYARSLVDDGCFGEIPDSIAHYIDYDAITRDLRIDHETIETSDHQVMVFHS